MPSLDKTLLSFTKILLTIIFIMGPSMFFGLSGKSAEMAMSIVAGALASAFMYLDKLSEFSGGGFSLKLKETIRDVELTIEKLQKLLLPTLKSNIGSSISLGFINAEDFYKDDLFVEHLNTAKELGYNKEKQFCDFLVNTAKYGIWLNYKQIYSNTVGVSSTITSKLEKLYNASSALFVSKKQIDEILKTDLTTETDIIKGKDGTQYEYYTQNYGNKLNIYLRSASLYKNYLEYLRQNDFKV